MSYIVNKTTAMYVPELDVTIAENLPFGIWQPVFDKFRGIYLEKYDYKLEHGKIYGKSQSIANHIYAAYKKLETGNLGVLLSGGKGLGKSLTARLVIEKAVKDAIPTIVISEYIPGIADFLKDVNGAVILFDEFEKTFSGKANEDSNDNDSITKQQELLSLLDGTAAGNNNLYILTVNEANRIDDCLKSRPGRIKYHYRYESEGEDTIRSYCADHLEKKDKEQAIVDTLLANRYVSLDIIRALVDEINQFDVSVDEAMLYLNIETDRINVEANVTFVAYGKEQTQKISLGSYHPGRMYLNGEVESSDAEDAKNETYYFGVAIPMKGKQIPTIGTLDVSDTTEIYNYYDGEKSSGLQVTKVEIFEQNALSNAMRVNKVITV